MTLATRQGSLTDTNVPGLFTFTHAVALDGDDDTTVFAVPPGVRAMSLQAVGTFDSGTIALMGSNDGLTFAAMPTAVSHTAAGAKSVAIADLGFRYYKLLVTGGGASTALFGIVVIRTDTY